jgi:pimeloyl-ACP methyl ester carboxylesterase
LFAPWEEHFTVVQWDQRGASRTLRNSGPAVAPTLTVDRMAQDGVELADYLRKHLAKDKIILVAHSFGSIIGLRMVQTMPDLFDAHVGTGQMADASGHLKLVGADSILARLFPWIKSREPIVWWSIR